MDNEYDNWKIAMGLTMAIIIIEGNDQCILIMKRS